MAGITRRLGLAITAADAGTITYSQLLEIFQEAVDNGDILADGNEEYVVGSVLPLIDSGVLRPSQYVEVFERQMNSLAEQILAGRTGPSPTAARPPGGKETDEPTIATQANEVGRVLRAYIAVHDDIFGGGFFRSLRRILPVPGFFQRIDFEAHGRCLGQLSDQIKHIERGIGIGDPPPQLERPLADYCEALARAISQLEHICRRLETRSASSQSYTREEYAADLVSYEELVSEYRARGEIVNRAFRALLS